MASANQLIKEAANQLRTLTNEKEELTEKVAAFERAGLAREIVLLKVASGTSEFEDVQDFEDEVEKLAQSDRNLGQLKEAMQYAGPSYVHHGLVESSDEGATVKIASTPGEPEHIRQARLELEASMSDD